MHLRRPSRKGLDGHIVSNSCQTSAGYIFGVVPVLTQIHPSVLVCKTTHAKALHGVCCFSVKSGRLKKLVIVLPIAFGCDNMDSNSRLVEIRGGHGVEGSDQISLELLQCKVDALPVIVKVIGPHHLGGRFLIPNKDLGVVEV